jgi:flagellar motor switch protein FliG
MAAATRSRGELMSGAQKAAVLCLAVGPERAAKILQMLTQVEVEAVSREIAVLQSVGADTVDGVMQEYRDVARAVDSMARGGVDVARQILEQAVGSPRAKGILERIQTQSAETGLKRLKRAAPEVLLSVLRGEHPQTVALILAHLDMRQAVSVIEVMDPQLAADVLYRVARMEKVAPEMLQIVEAGLASKADLSLSTEMTLSGGPSAVANVLNLTSPSIEKGLLDAIGQRDTGLAEAIKGLMFVFEDLQRLDARSMQRVLRDIDGKELALALKVASDGLKQHILKNMSERAAGALTEEMEYLGPVKVKDVEAAHGRIIQAVRALEESGEITVAGRGDADDLVA